MLRQSVSKLWAGDDPKAILDAAAYRASLREGDHPSRAVVRLPVQIDADGDVVDASVGVA